MSTTASSPPPTPPPRRNELTGLFEAYEHGDLVARELLATRHLPMARRLAASFSRPGVEDEDLEQVAALALLKAIDRYDPARGRFAAFATTSIRGELRRHFRDTGWTIRVPRPVQERWLTLQRLSEEFERSKHSRPTATELATEAGLSLGETMEAMGASSARSPLSLDGPGMRRDHESTVPLHEVVGGDDGGYRAIEFGATIRPAVSRLSSRQREVLKLSVIEGLPQVGIAERLGVAQSTVSRHLTLAIEALAREIGPEPAVDTRAAG